MSDTDSKGCPCSKRRVRVLGQPFDAFTLRDAVDWATRRMADRQGSIIVTVNSTILVDAVSDALLRSHLKQADVVVCDGAPLVWLSRWLGEPLPERVAGIDLMRALVQEAGRVARSVFLLGGRPGVGEAAAREITRTSPGIIIAGIQNGYVDRRQGLEVMARIAAIAPDLLVVGMGHRREAEWFLDARGQVSFGVAIGVGGSLDVLAGRFRRAPLWMQSIGLEWAYRMAQEPRRLGPRYFRTALGIAGLLLRQRHSATISQRDRDSS